MEGFCPFVLDCAALDPPFSLNEKSDRLEVTEVWHPSYELRERQVPDAEVGPWLTETPPLETKDSALLRLVWVRLLKNQHPRQLNIRNSSLDAVLEKFKIQEAYRYSFTRPGNFAIMPARRTDDSNTLVFSLCMTDFFAVAWTHDSASGRTEGVCWADDWVSEAMQAVMSDQKGLAQHPLFLALAACVVLGYLLDRGLDREVKSIAGVENRTKYGFKSSIAEVAEGDYASLSQRMSGSAVSLAGLERISKILNEFLGDISIYSQRYGSTDLPRSEDVNLKVTHCVETLKKRLKMQDIQIDYLSRRVEVQLTAATQKEAKVGIAVAEDSRTIAFACKEDSTAMKTLAAVTVAFLPGTFVAAFCAMPLFDWNANGDGVVVSKRFWIYWAITVPLTFLTLGVWAWSTRRQARLHKKLKRRTREELWADTDVKRGGRVEGTEIGA